MNIAPVSLLNAHAAHKNQSLNKTGIQSNPLAFAGYQNKINQGFDTVSFGNKQEKEEASESYKNLVKSVSDDTQYKKALINADDIDFLLKLNDEDFKDIITKPVKCDDNGKRKPYDSTIFFYTSALATKKLLNKLNDKEAAFEILKVQKGWRGTTAMHTAAFTNDAFKAKVLCASVSNADCRALLKLKDTDDTPDDVAISCGREVRPVFKNYFKC